MLKTYLKTLLIGQTGVAAGREAVEGSCCRAGRTLQVDLTDISQAESSCDSENLAGILVRREERASLTRLRKGVKEYSMAPSAPSSSASLNPEQTGLHPDSG